MKESMKLALEAAYLAGWNASGEGYNAEYPFGDHARNPEEDAAWIKGRDNVLREALAEQPAPVQQEPAWRTAGGIPRFKPAQQEPVARVFNKSISWRPCDIAGLPAGTPLYTSPPAQRKPLTDEEKLMCWSRATHDADVEHKTEHQCLMDYGTEIEAKHGIKEQP